MAPKRKKPKRIVRTVKRDCPFCKNNTNPDYKNYEELTKYVSDRAKILGSKRSGICSKHQRRVSVAVKRARHLGLLPFTPSL